MSAESGVRLKRCSTVIPALSRAVFFYRCFLSYHLPPPPAVSPPQILTQHRPNLIFFGAATSNQDLGNNPTHLNENTLTYWVRKFKKQGYTFDAPRGLAVRAALLSDDGYQRALQTGKAWWFVKNVMVFARLDAFGREQLDGDVADAVWVQVRLPRVLPCCSICNTYLSIIKWRTLRNISFGQFLFLTRIVYPTYARTRAHTTTTG